MVELNGSSAGATADGFTVTGDNSEFRGLAINRFGDDAFNVDAGAAGTVIAGNHIGTDASGLLDRGNGGSGIDLGTGSGPTLVGGTAAEDRNVISGNGNDGIIIFESDGNTIIGNYIGTDITGNAPLPNAADGIALGSTSSNNIIGQPGAGNVLSGNTNDGLELDNDLTGNIIQSNIIGLGADGSTLVPNNRHGLVLYDGVNNTQVGGTGAGEGNVISGNTQSGVVVDGNGNVATAGNTLEGNYIGTDVTGTLARGNLAYGIHLFAGANGNTIGGNIASARNLIGGNVGSGIQIDGANSSGNTISGNYVGLDVTGTGAQENTGGGVVLNAAVSTTVGGTTIGERNVITGNGAAALSIINGANLNVVEGNYIGLDKDGAAGVGNRGSGVTITDSPNNTIGGTVAGAGNVISSNDDEGISISGAASTGNVVWGNLVGLDPTGMAARANLGGGVVIWGAATGNTIGGIAPSAANTISGNLGSGIRLSGAGTTGNSVQGNIIGLNTAGSGAVANTAYGVSIQGGASSNTIGGTTAAHRNVLSGNGTSGIEMTGAGTDANTVEGNYVGLNAAGDAAIPNGAGIRISTGPQSNVIGGTAVGAGNVISGNTGDGVYLWNPGTELNDVQGNLIGTDPTGTGSIANLRGIHLGFGAVNNTIGGATAAHRNVISGNTTTGVIIESSGAADNAVIGNYIGVDSTGTGNLGNGGDGVYLQGGTSGNAIGGSAATMANVIAFNGADGIRVGVDTSDNNPILRNSIHSNVGLGIDLDPDGVTPNDGLDTDTGPNDGLNFPVINSATETGGLVTLTGTFDVPAGWYRFEFFTNTVADPSGNGEGETFVGSTPLTHTGSGDEPWGAAFPGLVGDIITATLTECTDASCTDFDSTSEFSAAHTVTPGNQPPVFDQNLLNRADAEASWISLSAGATDPDVGDTLTYSATGLPLGLSINPATGLITGLVNYYAAASSPYPVEITVCDDGAPIECDTDTFTWTINNVLTTDPYVVADTGGANGGDDLLTEVNPLDLDPVTNEVDIGTGTGTTTLRGLAIEPVSGVLYGAAGNRLGSLNVDSGVFTPVGGTFGSGDGDQGVVTFDNVVGLAFHPLTGELFAVHHVAADRDLLFNVDPATGAAIPGTFNAGRDYVELGGSAPLEVTDIAIDPTDWATYGVFTDGAGGFELRAINRWNGSTNKVGDVTPEIRGLTVQSTGQMWGTDSSALYEIDKTSGVATSPRPLDNGSQYGAVALAVPPAYPPAVEGIVFEDISGNGVPAGEFVQDFLNPGVGGVTMRLYLDDGSVPGEPDAGDTLWANKLTGPTGHYFFSSIPAGTYWLTADSSDVSPSAGGTGWAEQTYGPIEAVTFDGSYSFAGTAGPLYGGKQPTVSDNAASLTTAEHVVRVDLSPGEEIEQVDLGFSFNVVTNLAGRRRDRRSGNPPPIHQQRQHGHRVRTLCALFRQFPPTPPRSPTNGGAWRSARLSPRLPRRTRPSTEPPTTQLTG